MVNSSLPSLKRIRSASTSKANGGHKSTEPTGKSSKLKSGLRIWSKLTRPFTSHQQQPRTNNDEQLSTQHLDPSKWRRRLSHHLDNQRLSTLLNYNYCDTRQEALPGRTLLYEPGRLLHNSASFSNRTVDLRRNSEVNTSINAQTTPPAIEIKDICTSGSMSTDSRRLVSSGHHLKAPTSILVKRDDSTISTRALGIPVRPKSSSLSSGSYHGTHHRHHRFSSSNITANSEDLTAKEFADIAGIRILDECEPRPTNNDSCCFDEDMVFHNTISTARSSLQQRSHARSMPSASSLRVQPQIWDAEFWQNPDVENNSRKQYQQQGPRLLRVKTNSTDKPFNRSSCVIKKGRFEICLETAVSADAFMSACGQSQQLQERQQQQQQQRRPQQQQQQQVICGMVPKISGNA